MLARNSLSAGSVAGPAVHTDYSLAGFGEGIGSTANITGKKIAAGGGGITGAKQVIKRISGHNPEWNWIPSERKAEQRNQ